MKLKTVHWKFLESLEPPRVVHARCTDVISKENVFGQVTCRFHTKQVWLHIVYDTPLKKFANLIMYNWTKTYVNTSDPRSV